MAKHIASINISDAWVQAMEHLLENGGKVPNLMVSISPQGVGKEIPEARRLFDAFLKEHESSCVRRIDKVADTIFPTDLYVGAPGEEARKRLYKMQRLASKIERRFINRGTYFDRLIDWPGGPADKIGADRNQLERHITRLQARYRSGTKNHNNYELAVSLADTSDSIDAEALCLAEGGNLRLQDPILDPYQAVMGFPCLSHISLTLFKGRLDMTAIYRNQYFITKSYGNYVGLSRLLSFIATEVGCVIGELVCIATHASIEIGVGGIRKAEIQGLVRSCRTALNAHASKP